MSKKVMYLVNVEGAVQEVFTLREVTELLGRKVSKKEILDGKVEEVSIREVEVEGEVPETDIDLSQDVPEGYGRVRQEDGTYAIIPLTNPLDKVDDIVAATGEEDTNLEGYTEEEDIVEDEIEEDTEVEEEDTTKEDIEEDSKEEDVTPEDTKEEDTKPKSDMASLLARLKEINDKKGNTKDTKKGKTRKIEFTGEFPEVGTFKEEKELKKFYKQLTDDQLNEWIELEGLKYKACPGNEPIERMRKCMAILYYHFPRQTSSSKKKSKYSDLSTEQLLEMALDNNLDVKDGKGDARILRMYAIMALREAGLID